MPEPALHAPPERLPGRLWRALRHLWMDEDDTRRAVPEAVARQWEDAVARCEHRHGGEVCLCVEAALPRSYLWRMVRGTPVQEVVRQRARMMFRKLGVWDTASRSGVLIYVLLAEHAIEIVADRGLQRIPPAQWQAVADALAQEIGAQRTAQGLLVALDQLQALIAPLGLGADQANELPDPPHLQ